MTISYRPLVLGLAITTLLNPGSIINSHISVMPQVSASPMLSANIPLDSYIYGYLEKLDGLGYLQEMRPGAKPYTRMQVAGWVQQMLQLRQDEMPGFAKHMLSELKQDLKMELDMLSGKHSNQNKIKLREWSLSETYYKGNTYAQGGTKSAYQPLNINSNGRKYTPHLNSQFTFQLDGQVGTDIVYSVIPEITYDNGQNARTRLVSGYVKTKFNNTAIQVGRDPMWWGQGTRGSLLLTNNATPQTSIKLTNINPTTIQHGYLRFLRKFTTTAFYSILEQDRSDVESPSFAGVRFELYPTDNLVFSANRTSMIGGQGHSLAGSDYIRLISSLNGRSASVDQWNTIAGYDLRWRIPRLNNTQLYLEYFGEDSPRWKTFTMMPRHNAELLGLYFPRINKSGDLDLQLEWAHTNHVWYAHGLYSDGYTYKNDVLGDAMGNNAIRYYAKVTHYLPNANQISLHAEKMSHQVNTIYAPNTLKITSYWLSGKFKISKNVDLNTSVGTSYIRDAHFVAGSKERNYLYNANIVGRF